MYLEILKNITFNFPLSKVSKMGYKTQIIWPNVVGMFLIHLAALYSLTVAIQRATPRMILASASLVLPILFGIQIGAHRMWSHRSFKAKWPLRLFLMLCQTYCLQKDIYDWCREHRVHHKYSETDADPHNSNRGWFFAHMGWLMCKKHPEVIAKGKTVNLSDLLADPIVFYQRKFYWPLAVICWGMLPTAYLYYVGGCQKESWLYCFGINLVRYMAANHATWSVNSSAHLFGTAPYNKAVQPRENRKVAYFSFGEGYHNYHHSFPWDYVASELNWKNCFNPCAALIDILAWLGLVYDLKRASTVLVVSRVSRCGDLPEWNRKKSVFADYLLGVLYSQSIFLVIYFLNLFYKNLSHVTYYVDGYYDDVQHPSTADYFICKVPFYVILLSIFVYLFLAARLIPYLMSTRKPFSLKKPLFLCNIFLTVANFYFCLQAITRSGFGVLLLDFSYPGPETKANADDVAVGNLYVWSKFVDWFDTFFFALRKKDSQMTFLHLYHHSVVPLLAYLVFRRSPSMPLLYLFIACNGLVHTVMYAYFALASFGPQMRRHLWWKKYITQLQLVQFVIFFLYGAVMVCKQEGYPMFWFLFGWSQILLFLWMFWDFYRRTYRIQQRRHSIKDMCLDFLDNEAKSCAFD